MNENLRELSQQLTLQEAADTLKYSKRHIEKMCARGELPSIGRGKLRRITLADIREYQRRNRNEGGQN